MNNINECYEILGLKLLAAALMVQLNFGDPIGDVVVVPFPFSDLTQAKLCK